ncbi:rolling circle replication-associated protein [Rubrolithibacter danxiaensis]|uniref:rolling circle replication-associated protein n=1 Tax=Rubrolithibacter danxiaensis TaxID=3390805 RepID=UPI003BF8FAAC
MLVKNTFGLSSVLGTFQAKKSYHSKFAGSSLDRKKSLPKEKEAKVETVKKEKVVKERKMSPRTKTKIRKKIFALSQVQKRLTFVALTFVNAVKDEEAIIILRKFLDNIKKRSKDFQYLWVAERQTENKVFPDNIHFHLITNKYWDIKKTLNYWTDLQASHGIVPRGKAGSSGFDVKTVSSKNPSQLGIYLTKYVTKNTAKFKCQVWNCSKKISALYTDFYSDYSFIEQLQKLKGDAIKEVQMEYCTLHLIPLDKSTIRFYDKIGFQNQKVWSNLKLQNNAKIEK